MTCTCGHPNPDNHRFCGMCGAKLERAPEPPARAESRRLFDLRDPNDPARVIAPAAVPPDAVPVGNNNREAQLRQETPVAGDVSAGSDVLPALPRHPGEESFTPVNRIDEPRSAARQERPADAPESRGYSHAGPSFLGLDSGEQDESDKYAYLTEEEQRPRRGIRWGALIAVAVVLVMAVVFYNLYTNRESWDSTIVKDPAAAPAPQAPQQLAQTNEPASPVSEDSAQQNEAVPQNDGVAAETAAAPDAESADGGKTSSEASEPPRDAKEAADKAGDEIAGERKPAPSRKPAASRREEAPREETNYAGAELYARGDAYLRANNCGGVELIRSAAESGNAQARSRMGALYYTGKCVDQSYAQAYDWFTRAKQAGLRSPSLETMLARARQNMETSVGTKVPERF